MTEDRQKYMQAFHRQQWDKMPSRVVLIERLPECYRLTAANGIVTHVDNAWGLKHYPVAMCGAATRATKGAIS